MRLLCVCVCIWLLLVAEKVCFCNTLKSWEIFGGVKTNLLNGVYLLMAVFTHWISVLLLGCLSRGLTENETKPWANCQISTHIKRGKVHKRKHFQLRLKENVTSKQSHSYQISFQSPPKIVKRALKRNNNNTTKFWSFLEAAKLFMMQFFETWGNMTNWHISFVLAYDAVLCWKMNSPEGIAKWNAHRLYKGLGVWVQFSVSFQWKNGKLNLNLEFQILHVMKAENQAVCISNWDMERKMHKKHQLNEI